MRKVRFIDLPDDAGSTPLDQFQAVLDRDEALRAVSWLEPDERIVVVLHYWAGLTLAEIATRLQWPLGTVKSRLHKGLERMRSRLATQPLPIEAPR